MTIRPTHETEEPMTPNPNTAIIIFSRATHAAITLARTATTPKAFRAAQFAAYANARALWRAALSTT